MSYKKSKENRWGESIIWTYDQKNENFGFVDVKGKQKGYFVYNGNRNTALHWDKVRASLSNFNGKIEATIEEVLERTQKLIIWEFTQNKKVSFVVPHTAGFQNDIFIAPQNRSIAKNWEIVGVKILDWEKDRKNPEWKVVVTLWEQWSAWIKVMSILLEGGARLDFPDEVVKEAEDIEDKIELKEWKNRKWLTKLFTYTIDGEDAKDLDDAISIKKRENGDYRLYVHIADVTHYVKENQPLDKEALERATSIYVADRVVPMLPEKLSNGMCSLNPNTDKLTLTCEMTISPDGKLKKSTVYESVINSNFRLTYKEVDAIVEWEIKAWDTLLFWWKVDEELIKQVKVSHELKEKIAGFREDNGILGFDFPETKVLFDDEWEPESIQEYPKYDSNKIIEHFMVSANEAVSRKFHAFPFLYRVHEDPDPGDVLKLQEVLNLFGVKHNIMRIDKITTKDVDILIDAVAQLEDSKRIFLQKKILRTLTQAKYSDKNEGHFGLWIEHYSHFTSPIRRYPDLQIHRIIKEKLSGRLDEKRISHYKGMLSEIWEHASAKEREAEKLEYKVRDHFVVELYKERIWEEFEATISGVISSWFFVALPDSAEGFVKVENAHFDEIYQSLQFGKNKHSLWQKVKVRLVSADEFRSKLYFDLI